MLIKNIECVQTIFFYVRSTLNNQCCVPIKAVFCHLQSLKLKYRYLKVGIHLQLLISQSTFSVPRKFTL